MNSNQTWDYNPDTNKSNDSPEFHFMRLIIKRLIVDEAFMLLSGNVESTAGLILAQLTHEYGFGIVDREQFDAAVKERT